MYRIFTRSSRLWLVVTLLGIACAITVFAQQQAGDPPTHNGKSLYLHNCAVCHAANGTGDTYFGKRDNVGDLRYSVGSGITDAELEKIISNGLGYQMGAYGKVLSPDQIQAIVTYIRHYGAQGESKQAAAPAANPVEAGHRIFQDQSCLACHKVGSEGGTAGPDLTRVACQRSRAQLLARMQMRRAGQAMPPLPPTMSDKQLNQLVDYLLTLNGGGCK